MAMTRRDLLSGLFQAQTQTQDQVFLPAVQTPAAAGDPILHLLSRITWGARPDEVQRARDIGYEAILDEQLAPESIDDSAADAEMQRYALLTLDRRTIYGLNDDSEYRTYKTMIRGMIARAVHSRRQLLERMVEFWADHFNVSMDDRMPDFLAYQRDVIRKHALGNFNDFLIDTARSPSMLVYLDNYVNFVESPNENYARELLELHTMGVDGGYTETDVKEVARAFTGWTVHDGTQTGFYFDPFEHDTEAKTILGHQLPANRGIEDGLHVLSIVAHHPETARFMCRKLAVRFVNDNPPQSLIDSMVQVWMQTSGEIVPVLRHMFMSDEFLAAVGQKFRRPLDFFIGAVRATGATFRYWWGFEEVVMDLGQMPYGWGPPNGYPDVGAAWMNTNGLLSRWNTAMLLTHSAYGDQDATGWGMRNEIRQRIGEPSTILELVDAIATQIFGAPLPVDAKRPFIDYASDGAGGGKAITPHLLGTKLGSLFGLMLASPVYQWR